MNYTRFLDLENEERLKVLAKELFSRKCYT